MTLYPRPATVTMVPKEKHAKSLDVLLPDEAAGTLTRRQVPPSLTTRPEVDAIQRQCGRTSTAHLATIPSRRFHDPAMQLVNFRAGRAAAPAHRRVHSVPRRRAHRGRTHQASRARPP